MENRNFESGASASPPSAPGSPSNGYPTNGNPGTGTPATIPGEFWFHQIGEEIRAAIVAAGLTPSSSDLTQLTQAIKSLNHGYMLVRDEKSSGTDGGGATAGATATRTLNTVVYNSITDASLASNKITLPAGTYLVRASAPAMTVNRHKAWIYNVTDATTQSVGTVENSDDAASSDNITTRSVINALFTIAGTKDFEIRHYTEVTRATDGFGRSLASPGLVEVYTQCEITKVA